MDASLFHREEALRKTLDMRVELRLSAEEEDEV